MVGLVACLLPILAAAGRKSLTCCGACSSAPPQVTELGDKTFFIAAVLAMRQDRWAVYLGAVGALALMTVRTRAKDLPSGEACRPRHG